MLAAPFDIAAFARVVGAPVALSDGHQVIASTGDGAQAAMFAALPGREGAGQYVSQASGQLAVAAPASATVWVWTLAAIPAPVPVAAGTNPEIWLSLAGLFGVSALLFGRARARGGGRLRSPRRGRAPCNGT